MSCEPYEQLLRERASLLRRLSPHGPRGLHCPEAADAVNDFLRTGDITPVLASGSTEYLMSNRLLRSWRSITFPLIIARLTRNCRHVVVRGVRDPVSDGLSAHHYFIVARIRSQFWIIDAYIHQMTIDFREYNDMGGFHHIEIPTVAYDVIARDPLAGIGSSDDPLDGAF